MSSLVFGYTVVVVVFIINIKAEIHKLLCIGKAVFDFTAVCQRNDLPIVHTCITDKAEARLIGKACFKAIYFIRYCCICEQNISVVPKLLKYDKTRCAKIVQEMLKLVHMEDYAEKYPSELSGGQQQRIGVLRALAASPPIVLMDEPFGALDPQTREALQDEVKNLQQRLGKTIIFVTHDMDEALKLADIIIFMDGGEVVQMASPEEMLENPATERVRSFLGKHASGTQPPSKVEQFMRTNVQSVQRDRGILECAERMARHSVDTLLVVDECNRYAGTVSIGDIRAWGKELKTIDPIIRQTARTVRIGDDAKESFDYLLESGASYVIVLNEDDTVAGIVTKTSVARAVAETLWGDEK